MKTIEYKINGNDFLMTENYLRLESAYVLNDKPRVISQEEMFQDYFDTVYGIFVKKLKKLKDSKCALEEKEEKKLQNMLKDLIISHKNIYKNREC